MTVLDDFIAGCKKFHIDSLSILLMATEVWAELSIDSVYPTQGKLGEALDITIAGSEFDADTRVSMYLE